MYVNSYWYNHPTGYKASLTSFKQSEACVMFFYFLGWVCSSKHAIINFIIYDDPFIFCFFCMHEVYQDEVNYLIFRLFLGNETQTVVRLSVWFCFQDSPWLLEWLTVTWCCDGFEWDFPSYALVWGPRNVCGIFEFGDPFGSDLSSVRNLYFVVKWSACENWGVCPGWDLVLWFWRCVWETSVGVHGVLPLVLKWFGGIEVTWWCLGVCIESGGANSGH